MESLLKDDPVMNIQDQKVRTIMWNRYVVSAIFSPIFKQAKTRLKALLNK